MAKRWRQKNSPFENKWGERAENIADREGVSEATIHMRVHNFGSPYQRRGKPTKWEVKYWKTAKELCHELRLHIQTLELRERKYGTIYCEDMMQKKNRIYSVPDMKPVEDQKPWLMREHPDYVAWRSGVMFPEQDNE